MRINFSHLFFAAVAIPALAASDNPTPKPKAPVLAGVVKVKLSDGEGKQLRESVGVVVEKSGIVLMSLAALTGARKAEVVLTDGTVRIVQGVTAFDYKRDYVVLRVDGKDWTAASVRPPGELTERESLYWMGGDGNVAEGAYEGKVKRFSMDQLKTKSGLLPGMPLFDRSGRLVGLVVASKKEGSYVTPAASMLEDCRKWRVKYQIRAVAPRIPEAGTKLLAKK
jgi:hypothetical protein